MIRMADEELAGPMVWLDKTLGSLMLFIFTFGTMSNIIAFL